MLDADDAAIDVSAGVSVERSGRARDRPRRHKGR